MNKTANKELRATAPLGGSWRPLYGLEVCKRSATKYLVSQFSREFESTGRLLVPRQDTRANRTRHTTNSTTTRQTGTHERTPDNAYFGHDFGFLVLVLDPLIAAETP